MQEVIYDRGPKSIMAEARKTMQDSSFSKFRHDKVFSGDNFQLRWITYLQIPSVKNTLFKYQQKEECEIANLPQMEWMRVRSISPSKCRRSDE